jgi:signal transduction histidine kinase
VRLDGGSLVSALSQLAEKVTEDHGVACTFECFESINFDDDYLVDQLYLIAQEAALNAARHSSADLIEIGLHRDGHTLTLRIADNGTGLDASGGNESGLGLHIMPYRAATVGGDLTVTTGPGEGTVVKCTLMHPA